MEINQGYEICKYVLFDNGRGFAMGVNPAGPSPFVTWQFDQKDGKRYYYWGNYFNTEYKAAADYNARESEYKEQYNVSLIESV